MKEENHFKVQIILGSTRPIRIGKDIADWVYAQCKNLGLNIEFELVDLMDWPLPLLDEPVPAMSHVHQHEHTKKWSAKVAEADGYIIVTPEYNAGYPAVLKNSLDYLWDELKDKPVAIVAYGINGGRTVDRQLRQVLTRMQMNVLPEKVSIITKPTMFDERHRFIDADRDLADYQFALDTLARAIAKVFGI